MAGRYQEKQGKLLAGGFGHLESGIFVCYEILGFLFVMKYWDFVMGNLNSIVQTEVFPILNLSLPIGISFYTFQAMSYVIDVYRRDAAVQKNPLYVALYISLFPQLVAGPIIRLSLIHISEGRCCAS